MVIPLATIHGPRSMPLRTRDRGAGIRQAPWAQASHISSQEASNATDRPAITLSPGPIGRSWRNSRASASTNAAALRCCTATPFGRPVDPDVKMTQASSSGPGSSGTRAGAPCVRTSMTRSASDQRGHLRLVEHQPGPCCPGRRRRPGRTTRRPAVRRGSRHTARTSRTVCGTRPGLPRTDAGAVQLSRDGLGGLEHLAVGQDVRAAVDRGVVRPPRGGLAEDRHQGSWRGGPVGPQQAHATARRLVEPAAVPTGYPLRRRATPTTLVLSGPPRRPKPGEITRPPAASLVYPHRAPGSCTGQR